MVRYAIGIDIQPEKGCHPVLISIVLFAAHILLMSYFFIVIQIAQTTSQCYSNVLGNLGNLFNNKEI